MNRIFLLAAVLLLTIGSPLNLMLAADYYVIDNGGTTSGDGSIGDPFGTITEALNNAPLAAGDNINIAAGTYSNAHETFPLVLPDGVSLVGANSTTTVIDSTGSGATNVQINGGNGLRIIRNLSLVCDGTEGLQVNSANGTVRVASCLISGDNACSDLLQVYHDNNAGSLNLQVVNCTFMSMTGECVDIEGDTLTGDVSLCFTSNSFLGSANSFSQCLEIDLTCTDNASADVTFKVLRNYFFDGDSSQINADFSAETSALMNLSVSIVSNTFSEAGDDGINFDLSASDLGRIDAVFGITCNYIYAPGDDGLDLQMYVSSTGYLTATGDISGNSIVMAVDNGIQFALSGYHDTIEMALRVGFNCILSASSNGLWLSVSSFSDLNVTTSNVFYGNVIMNCSFTGVDIDGDWNGGSRDGNLDFGGGVGGMTLGRNTIQDNAMSSGWQWLCDSDSSNSGDTYFAHGNWWGTTSLSAIEATVYHQPDNASVALVDFSSPLVDPLILVVPGPVSGGFITVNAGTATAFVPYAGKKLIDVRLGGVPVINPQVSPDGLTLTFFAPAVGGQVLLEVWNPGGQYGSLLLKIVIPLNASRCFVATASYGDEDAPEVLALRKWRDEHLADNLVGRQLVKAYYALSPGFAEAISERPWAQTVSRAALAPVVGAARLWMELPWAFALGGAAAAWSLLRRRRS